MRGGAESLRAETWLSLHNTKEQPGLRGGHREEEEDEELLGEELEEEEIAIAREALEKAYDAYIAALKKRIKAQEKKEAQAGLSWERFGISKELREIEKRNKKTSGSGSVESGSSKRRPRRRAPRRGTGASALY